MTEAEWLAGGDARFMLSDLLMNLWEGERRPAGAVQAEPAGRKLRLYAAACCRHAPDCPPGARVLHAVETAERLADGEATQADLDNATWRRLGFRSSLLPTWAFVLHFTGPRDAANAVLYNLYLSGADMATAAALLREIFGNPWRPQVYVPGGWLAWNGGAVPALARSVYEGRRWEELPCVADALEEAGADPEDPLCRHFRGLCEVCWGEGKVPEIVGEDLDGRGGWEVLVRCPCCQGSGKTGPHVRGCWALDLVLGKE